MHTPFLAKQAIRHCKSTLHRSVPYLQSKGPSANSVKNTNAGQAMEKKEPDYADGQVVNCQQPLWRSVCCFLKQSYRA